MTREPEPPGALHLARRAVRHLRLSAVLLAIGLGATAAAVYRTRPVFRSEAVLLYRAAPRFAHGESDSARRAGARLADQMLARSRLRLIADELGLDPDLVDRGAAVDRLRKSARFHVRDGSTFLISYDSPAPELAQKVVARLAETLIRDTIRQRAREAQEMRRLLEVEAKTIDLEVKAHEAALAGFLEKHPETVLTREWLSVTAGPAGDTDTEVDRSQGGARRDQVGMDSDLMTDVRRARLELAQARRELAQRQERLTDAHPDLIAARERLGRMEEDSGRMAGILVIAPDSGGPQIAAREPERGVARRDGGERVRRMGRHALRLQVPLSSLRHSLEQARDRAAGIGDRRFQADLVAKLETSGEIGTLTLLDPAARPGLPLADARKKVALAGAAAAVLVALGAALLRSRFDDRVCDLADARWLLGSARVLGAVRAPRESEQG